MQRIPGVNPYIPGAEQAYGQAFGQGQGPAIAPPPQPMQQPLVQSRPDTGGGGWLSRLTGQNGKGGFSDRLNNAFSSPLFTLGMSLLGNAQGSNWAGVGQDLRAYGQDQRERQALENEQRRQAVADKRESEQWQWAQQERSGMTERRRLAQEYINSRPEAERAELRMVDPDELGSYLQQQRDFDLRRQQLELQTQEARDNRAYRGASLAMDARRLEQDRLFNSAQGLLGRGEAERMNTDMGRLSNWRLVDNDIAALEEILQRNPAAFDQIMDGDQSVVLARVRDPQMRRDLNTIYAVSTNLAREELRGQTPVSNIDLLSAVRGNPNSQAGHLFVRDWLARARQDRADLERSVQSRVQYMQGGGGRSLYEPDPATGRNWYQSQDGYTRYGATGQSSPPPSSGGSASAEQQAAARVLAERQRAPASNGYGNIGGDTSMPRLLRQPRQGRETVLVREYQEALRNRQTQRARVFEQQMRQAGLVP
jgi:hypothetical protein